MGDATLIALIALAGGLAAVAVRDALHLGAAGSELAASVGRSTATGIEGGLCAER